MADLSPPLGGGLQSKIPGVLLRSPQADWPFDPMHTELLYTKIELKIGEDKIKNIEFSKDRMQAYVELIDKAGNIAHVFMQVASYIHVYWSRNLTVL